MIYETYLGGVLCHHGVKGQKWGVRRTPEQLGHKLPATEPVAKAEKGVKIVDGVYYSSKGFTAAVTKFTKYFLDPEKPHAKEFFDVGYKQSDSDLLFRHIEEGFDLSKKTGIRKNERGQVQFRIPMNLGVDQKKPFTTAWQIDKEGDLPKLTSAYRDRRSKGE